MSGEKLGIALVGFGDHAVGTDVAGGSHVQYLRQLPNCSLEGVADLNASRRQLADESRERLGLPEQALVTADYRELLTRTAVDAVVITTGDSSHLPIARDCLRPVDDQGRSLIREDGELVKGKHVLLEKPAAATIEQLAELPALFTWAESQGLRFWVCHPREFGDGPWRKAAELISMPQLISQEFGVGPMGALKELRYDCLYTLPGHKEELHSSFADDKLNHNIVSALLSLPNVVGFRDAVLLDNDARHVWLPLPVQIIPRLTLLRSRRAAAGVPIKNVMTAKVFIGIGLRLSLMKVFCASSRPSEE